jgi:hypothetical protein
MGLVCPRTWRQSFIPETTTTERYTNIARRITDFIPKTSRGFEVESHTCKESILMKSPSFNAGLAASPAIHIMRNRVSSSAQGKAAYKKYRNMTLRKSTAAMNPNSRVSK